MEPVVVKEHSAIPGRKLDALAREWRDAPRRWGHPLHSLCSYFAMFPPHVPRVFIEWLTQKGDVVYDPFSGRGTAPFEACRLGRLGLGSDANPLAYVLTGAKVDPPMSESVERRIIELRAGFPARGGWDAPADISMLYTRKVVRQLCWLRGELNIEDRTDRFIMAIVLGMMHANYKPGSPARGFSISMPNTFSMSPAYVRGYIEEHRLVAPDIDVFDMIRAKVARMQLPGSSAARGKAWLGDARGARQLELPARLVFTSPPYMSVIKYGKFNWIRLWMLRHAPKEVDEVLMATASLKRYLGFMGEVLAGAKSVVAVDGFVCLMIGDVSGTAYRPHMNLAEEVWAHAAQPAGWRRLGIVNDQLPEDRKVSRIWGEGRRGNATKVDRILILAPPGSKHRLPAAPRRVHWDPATNWAEI